MYSDNFYGRYQRLLYHLTVKQKTIKGYNLIQNV